MKKTLTTLIVLCGITMTSFAFPQSSEVRPLPFQRQDVLRNYAMSLVVSGTRTVYSDAFDWSKPVMNYTNVTDTCGERVLERLMAAKFQYTLIYGYPYDSSMRDYTFLYGGAVDQWGNASLLFYGYDSYPTNQSPNYIPLWMQNVPLNMFSGVVSAKINVFRPDGTIGSTNDLQIVDGHPLFPYWYAGAPNATLMIQYKNEISSIYSLSADKPSVNKVTTSSSPAWKVPGHYELKCKPVDSIKIVETWNLPSVYIEAKTASVVTFDVMAAYPDDHGIIQTERPTAIEFDTIGGGHTTREFNADRPTKVTIPKGVSRAYFDWPSFDPVYPIAITEPGTGKG